MEDINQNHDGQVMCRCGEFVDLVKHKVNYEATNEEGHIISAEAAENMGKHKVKCKSCKDIFCSKCKITPYHVGFTWSQYREFIEADRCRYCRMPIKAKRKGGVFRYVWKNEECKIFTKESWDKKLAWGHYCRGIRREPEWLPWLAPECVVEDEDLTLGVDANSNWVICLDRVLGQQPCIRLTCKHIFHVVWLINKVEAKWAGPRVTFGYRTCPSWKTPIDEVHHQKLNRLLQEAKDLEVKVRAKARERGQAEGLDKDERLKNPSDDYFEKFEEYAMDRLAFYQCYKCTRPYFGGLKECGDNLEENGQFDKKELICGACSQGDFKGKQNWDVHGADYIEWKCRYWWNYSQWFCFGTTHFCNRCHSNLTKNIFKCPGKPECQIEMDHPDDGSEFAMGWGMCKNEIGVDVVE